LRFVTSEVTRLVSAVSLTCSEAEDHLKPTISPQQTREPPTISSAAALPIVAVSCSLIVPEAGAPNHAVLDPYLMALARYADVFPILIPVALPDVDNEEIATRALLARVDGLLLTGSPSMIAPERYCGAARRPGTLHDDRRDSRTLPLVTAAIGLGIPVFGICRGAQEINCALGGTLHQAVHDLPGRYDHRAPHGLPEEGDKYLPRHRISLTKAGWLDELAHETDCDPTDVCVSTLHEQAIDRLGAGVVVEAIADDGIVEAIRVATARTFAVGVQWHPEWHLQAQPLNRRLFAAFGEACAKRAASRPTEVL
jgi:putative glutamine amidotransferase